MITVRRAAPGFANWQGLLDLILSSFAPMDGRVAPPSSANRLTTDRLRKRAAEEVLFLAHKQQHLLGCVFARPEPDHIYLGKLAVAPGHQGIGIGGHLVGLVQDMGRNAGLPVVLETRIELVENHAAFAKMGFVKTNETAHLGYERATSITMEWRVPLFAPQIRD